MSAPLGLSSIFYSVMSVAAPPSCAVVVPSQTVIPPSMCGANGAASSDALSVIGVFVPISVLLWFTLSARVHPPPSPPRPYETPPLAASVVWSECLSVDKAERAASAAHLG